MSDLSVFVLEADLSNMSVDQLNKIEEILLRSQNSAVAEIESLTSALKCINDARLGRGGEGGPVKKTPKN